MSSSKPGKVNAATGTSGAKDSAEEQASTANQDTSEAPDRPAAASSSETTTLWEIEQKYRVRELESVRQHLRSLSATFEQVETHCDRYLRHPSRDFAVTDEALRIRTVNGHSMVTYKGPRLKGKMKTRPEIELPLSDGSLEQWLHIWLALGFTLVAEVRKEREAWSVAQGQATIQVTLDTVPEVGTFVEIEMIATNLADRERVMAHITELASKLGVEEAISHSYLHLWLARGQNHAGS